MYLDTDSGKLYFEESGEGKGLVLIHGGVLDCRMWDDQLDAFSEHYRVIRYDVRGHGKSDPASEPYSDVEDLRKLLAFLGLEKAHLLGLSAGGRIAVDFALEHPSMVEGLILAAPGLSGYAFTDVEVARALGKVYLAAKAGDLSLARGLILEAPYWKQDDPAVRERIARMLAGHSFDGWIRPEMILDARRSAVGHLSLIDVPALMVVGDRDVSDILNIVDVLTQGIPCSAKAVIPGTSHMLNMQKPAEFNRIVLDFLTSL